MRSIGFIGGGRVTRILLRGWAHAAALPPSLVVHEPDDAAFAALGPHARVENRGALEAACAADVVFVALHPPQVAGALAAMKAALGPESTVVSLAPKITLVDIESAIGHGRVARVIPNAPSVIGRGFNPVAFGPRVPASDRTMLAAMFEPLGQFPEVAEHDLEAYAIIAAMGPTYYWPQFQALREVARACGLSPEAADVAIRAMIDGAVSTLLDAGLTPDAVMDLIPVKPLAEPLSGIVAAFHAALPALHRKIAPAPAAGVAREVTR